MDRGDERLYSCASRASPCCAAAFHLATYPANGLLCSETIGCACSNVAATHRRTSLQKTRPLNSACPLFFLLHKIQKAQLLPTSQPCSFSPSDMGERVHNKQIIQVNFLWWLTVAVNSTTCVSAAAPSLVQALH